MIVTRSFYRDNAPLIRVWEYLWKTYGPVIPRDISDAITIIQSRIVGAA